ncbi:ABCC2 [Scenedesmus sp. PABB004]|nr:ABCC2 [Scenedesmus sp. PABB004]
MALSPALRRCSAAAAPTQRRGGARAARTGRARGRAPLPPLRMASPRSAPAPAAIEGPSTDIAVIGARLQRVRRGARRRGTPPAEAAAQPSPTAAARRTPRGAHRAPRQLVLPYWQEVPSARWRLAGVVGLTLATTGVSVAFSYLGRDFFNALSERDAPGFQAALLKYLGGFVVGIPVFVFADYLQSRLALEWREWMTGHLLEQYFADRSFYQLQAGALVDNPDQRIAADVRQFTDAALGLSLTVLNSLIDLVSFSGILYSIYPPLFGALLAYSIGGTLGSIALGRSLVGLNFNQEAVEADMRYGLVRVRENAESIAFYGGQANEMAALMQRLRAVVANYGALLVASRNLDFFTSFYRFLIQLLPAAVVAPLFFAGKIEFGVINQSSSAFNHILNDVSLVVYQVTTQQRTQHAQHAQHAQHGPPRRAARARRRRGAQFETLAGFSAVVDRLGDLAAASAAASVDAGDLQQQAPPAPAPAAAAAALEQAAGAASGDGAGGGAEPAGPSIQVVHVVPWRDGGAPADGELLLELDGVSINTPDGGLALVQDLSLRVAAGRSLLIMGPSGAGKTSMLRTLAGLWASGRGTIYSHGLAGLGDPGAAGQGAGGGVLFLPQRPYMVLGSLRDQLLYPTWSQSQSHDGGEAGDGSNGSGARAPPRPRPSDEQLEAVLRQVQLGSLLQRCAAAAAAAAAVATPAEGAEGGPPPVMSATSAPHAVLSPPPAGAAGGGASSALDHVADWSGMLSLGEQQRLAFARLLLAAPRLALLDEATSALDTANEALLYGALLASGTTVISVGHRPSLVAFHEQVLQLGGGGGGGGATSWRVLPAAEAAAALATASP